VVETTLHVQAATTSQILELLKILVGCAMDWTITAMTRTFCRSSVHALTALRFGKAHPNTIFNSSTRVLRILLLLTPFQYQVY